MTREQARKSAECRRVERDLYHFQAAQLPPAEMRSIASHLELCPGCARRQQFESAMLDSMRSGLPRVPAPPGLRDRILASLTAEERAGTRTRTRWWRAPWLAPAMAALLLAMVLLPGWPRLAGVIEVEREVVVVDIDCERSGKSLAEQRRCLHPHHLNALRGDDGSLWNVALGNEHGRTIAAERGLRGARLRVRGELHVRIRTIQLSEYVSLGDTGDLSRS